MKPKPRFKGDTYLVTLRAQDGVFHARPSPAVNRIMAFCLAHAAQQFNIRVHAFVFMSNHFHLVVTDMEEQLGDFMHWLDLFTAKCLNVVNGRRGKVWDIDGYNDVKLCDADSVLEKILYVMANPVAAALVRKPSQWPGFISLPRHYEGTVFDIERPRVFFRQEGKSQKASVVPPRAKLELTVPPQFEKMSGAEFRKLLSEKLKGEVENLHESHHLNGKKFLGKEGVVAMPADHRPPSEKATLEREIIPHFACSDKEFRKKYTEQFKAFWRDHREAYRSFRKGDRTVEFPAGSYWWPRHAAARRKEEPPVIQNF